MPDSSKDFRYFELYHRGGIYGWAAFDLRWPPYCLLHLEIKRWSHNIFKELKKDWIFAQNIIRSLGCDIVTLIKEGDLREQTSYLKLVKAFGFPEPTQFTQTSKEI